MLQAGVRFTINQIWSLSIHDNVDAEDLEVGGRKGWGLSVVGGWELKDERWMTNGWYLELGKRIQRKQTEGRRNESNSCIYS